MARETSVESSGSNERVFASNGNNASSSSNSSSNNNNNNNDNDKHKLQLVRGATTRLLGLYGQVKQMSPYMLQSGLEKVEHVLPEWRRAESVIDVLDSRLDKLLVESGMSERVQKMGEKCVSGGQEVSKRASETREKWKGVRMRVGRGGELRGGVRRVVVGGLSQAREFSATRGKELLHVDVVEYSMAMIDGAADAVSRKVYDPIARKLAVSMAKASEAMSLLRSAVGAVMKSSASSKEQVKEQVRERLKQARSAAQVLSADGVAYAQAKYGEVVAKRIPEESLLHKSLELIARSPEVVKQVREKAELDASKTLLENMSDLLAAVRVVVFHHQEHQEHQEHEGDEEEQQEGDEEEQQEGDELLAVAGGGLQLNDSNNNNNNDATANEDDEEKACTVYADAEMNRIFSEEEAVSFHYSNKAEEEREAEEEEEDGGSSSGSEKKRREAEKVAAAAAAAVVAAASEEAIVDDEGADA